MADAQNTRTLIATFNDYGTARQAVRELIDTGVPSDSVYIHSNQKTAGAGSGGHESEEHHRSGFMEWWNSLFGRDHEDHGGYENTLGSGGTILRATVAAETVDSAVNILNRHGARDAGTPSDTGSVQAIEEELETGTRAIRRGGVRIYSHEDVSSPRDQRKPDPAKGVRTSPRLDLSPNLGSPSVLSGGGRTAGSGTLAGEATAGSAIQDASAASFTARDLTSDFRRHFEQSHGTGSEFESMRPAYEYGYRSGRDARYQGKSWDQVEDDLHSEYQGFNPESRWDRVRDAIRYGWESTSRRG